MMAALSFSRSGTLIPAAHHHVENFHGHNGRSDLFLQAIGHRVGEDPMTPRDFRAWRRKMGLTQE